MIFLLATLAAAPARGGTQVDLTLGVGPDGPQTEETIEIEEPGLLHQEILELGERELVEFRVFLDEHLHGEDDQADRFQFSAEIYAVTLNRRGEEKRRELLSRPRIRTLDDQPARIVQGADALRIELVVTPHAEP